MALEEKLDCAYVAKNIHRYLGVKTDYFGTVLLKIEEFAHRNSKDLITGESYKQRKERLKEKMEGIKKKCSSLGLNTENEIGAYSFARLANCFLPFWEDDISQEEFEGEVFSALESAAEELKAEYPHLEDRHVKINDDFVEKTYRWLISKVYSETDKGKEVELLEGVTISKKGEMFSVKTIPQPRSRWAETPVNTTWEPWKK